jgi:hypothetical protein
MRQQLAVRVPCGAINLSGSAGSIIPTHMNENTRGIYVYTAILLKYIYASDILSLIFINIYYTSSISVFITVHVSGYSRVFLLRKLHSAHSSFYTIISKTIYFRKAILRTAILKSSSVTVLMFKCSRVRQVFDVFNLNEK